MPARSRDVLEAAVPQVAVEHVLAAGQAGRPARDQDSLVAAEPGLGHGCRLQVEVDVVRGEEVEAAVPVVVEKGASRPPAGPRAHEPGPGGHVLELALAEIPVQAVLPVVGHVEVVAAVVVVVADAGPLPPAGALADRGRRRVLEAAVAAVAVEVARGLLTLREALERRAVHQEDVQPPVAVVVEEGDAAARRLEQVLVPLAPAERGHGAQPGLARDLGECEPQRHRSLRIDGARHAADEEYAGERQRRARPAACQRSACASFR